MVGIFSCNALARDLVAKPVEGAAQKPQINVIHARKVASSRDSMNFIRLSFVPRQLYRTNSPQGCT